MKYIQTLLLGCMLLGGTSLQGMETLLRNHEQLMEEYYKLNHQTLKSLGILKGGGGLLQKLPLPTSLKIADRAGELIGLASEDPRVIKMTAWLSLLNRAGAVGLEAPWEYSYTFDEVKSMQSMFGKKSPVNVLKVGSNIVLGTAEYYQLIRSFPQVWAKIKNANLLAEYKKQMGTAEKKAFKKDLVKLSVWLTFYHYGLSSPVGKKVFTIITEQKKQQAFGRAFLSTLQRLALVRYYSHMRTVENELLEKALAWKKAQQKDTGSSTREDDN